MDVVKPDSRSGCYRFMDLVKIHLNEGVTYSNLVIFFLAVSFGSVGLLVFADVSVAFVLEHVLHIQDDIKGTKAGQVVLYSEIIIAVTIWAWGMLSDRIGRKWVFFFGTLFIAASFVSMPFVTTYAQLIGVRLVFAPGAAAASAMLMALVCDYPRDDAHSRSRGKASAVMGTLAGLGAIFALFVLMGIPVWTAGGDSNQNPPPNPTPSPELTFLGTEIMFFSAVALALVCGAVSLVGLAPRNAFHHRHANLRELLTYGFRASRDPYVVLSYATSFCARAASSVVTLFLSVWIQDWAKQRGLPSRLGVGRAGEVTGILQVIALLVAPVIGVLADRFSRALVTAVCAVLGLGGFLLVGLLQNPYDWSIQLSVSLVMLAIGEMGMLIMSQSVLGLHAPASARGSISGLWALFGSLGIMFSSGVGGVLYDVTPGGPFFIFAGFFFLVSTYALVLFVLERKGVISDKQLLEPEDSDAVQESKPLIKEENIQETTA